MDLSDKLFKLFLQGIEESKSIQDLDGFPTKISCTIHDGSVKHIISISSKIEDMSSINKQQFYINFKDLQSPINETNLDQIKKAISEKISIFEEQELEKKRKQQEIIVDRLLRK